jgi:hypothetical protein
MTDSWQPIVTAPKVGGYDEFLLFDPDDGVVIGYWDGDVWSCDEGFVLHPTYWMPLPEPPK